MKTDIILSGVGGQGILYEAGGSTRDEPAWR